MAMNDFQAAIDYLISDRNTAQQAKRQGLFTSNMAQTPTTAIAPKVVDELFGDEYKRRNSGSSSSDNFDPFAGSPARVGSNPFGPSTNLDAMDWAARAASARANPNALSAGGSLFGILAGAGPLAPLLGVAAKYGVPAFADYMQERALADVQSRADEALAGRAANAGAYDYSGLNPVFGGAQGPYGDSDYDSFVSDRDVRANMDSLSPEAVAAALYSQGYTDTGGYNDNSSFSSSYTDAGGGSFDYSADTGYDR
jgi:hypothetical protein